MSPPDAIGPHDGVEMRIYGRHDVGSACNWVQRISCTSIIDALHTQRPVLCRWCRGPLIRLPRFHVEKEERPRYWDATRPSDLWRGQ
jgi:hypothetical protein